MRIWPLRHITMQEIRHTMDIQETIVFPRPLPPHTLSNGATRADTYFSPTGHNKEILHA